MWASSSAEWVFLQVATARIGAVLVNVNPAYRSHELRYILSRSRMKVIFLHENDSRANYVEILSEARDGAQDLELRHAVLLDDPSWENMIAGGVEPPMHEASVHDVVNIQYASGTTGKPKGVLLSHHNLVNNACLVGRRLGWTPEDRLCLPVPMCHCFGCVMGSLLSIVHRATLVLPAAQFDPLAVIQAVDRERCTLIYGVPTMFIAELDHPEFAACDTSSLRAGVMAGAPCPMELMKRVVEEMHCPGMTSAYGQTESSPAITQSRPEDPLTVRVGTVGRVLPATEVKIVDPESGGTLERGEQAQRSSGAPIAHLQRRLVRNAGQPADPIGPIRAAFLP